jgi:serine/threonine-protein kinase
MLGITVGAVLKRRYRLERLLGRGGMASVWLGHDDVLDRPVAVKVLSDTLACDPDFLARFRREATVAAGLSHPNLVGVYDYSESDERPYLVMEFVPGDDLGELIAREVRIDRDELARELLGAVAHIHTAGIIHRDIKPHNVVIAPDWSAKLIDFGIALPRDATSLTQTGLVLGTKRYAAPEVMEGRAATERSDLYSCGLVLRACGGRGTPALEALVASLTRTDPSSRPRSAQEALLQLENRGEEGERTQAFSPVFAGAPTQELPPTQGLPPSRRRRWAAAAILGALVALAVAVFAVTNSGRPTSDGTPSSQVSSGKKSGRQAEPPGAEIRETPPSSIPVPSGNDPVLGSGLNEEGFELIQSGRYEEAVPVLEESVRSFPPGSEELDYAYALFNLGDALLRSGRPEDAIPVLERRLEIPNQTDVVREELEAARTEAG